MNCERARDMMHDRLDEILPDIDGARLDAHRSSCPACYAVFAQLMDIDAGLSGLREATALPEVSSAWHLPRRRLLRALRVAAAVIFAVGVGLAVRTLRVDRVDQVEVSSVVHTAPTVKLNAGSVDRYLPIVKSTDRPDVHIVWLHRTLVTRPKDVSVPAGDGASRHRVFGNTLVAGRTETTPRV